MGAVATCDDATPSSAKFSAAVCASIFAYGAAEAPAYAVWAVDGGFVMASVAWVGDDFPMSYLLASGKCMQRRLWSESW